jgi:hypothetical protein
VPRVGVEEEALAERIREATRRGSPSQFSSFPWSDIVGLRNILAHKYFGIHWPFVWQTAVDHAPILRDQFAEILATDLAEQMNRPSPRLLGHTHSSPELDQRLLPQHYETHGGGTYQ